MNDLPWQATEVSQHHPTRVMWLIFSGTGSKVNCQPSAGNRNKSLDQISMTLCTLHYIGQLQCGHLPRIPVLHVPLQARTKSP
eukprot:3661983-Amphidinium_carterae.1